MIRRRLCSRRILHRLDIGREKMTEDHRRLKLEAWNTGREGTADSVLIKPLGTGELLRQLEALLVRHADKQLQQRNSI